MTSTTIFFASNANEIGQTNITTAKINTGDSPAVKQRPYITPLALRGELEKQIDELLEANIIRPSNSAYSNPVILVPKANGQKRLVVDYRKLNKTIVKDAYPLPHIEDIISQLGSSACYTKLDMIKSFHQVPIAEQDKHKTAFCCNFGLFEYNSLPFGLTISPNIFASLMNKVLTGILGKYAICFVDDILIYSKNISEHLQHLEEVLTRLESANLKLQPSKCEFLKPEVLYLGHVISPSGIHPDPEKVRVIKEMAPPETVKQVRSFLGMVGYYRKFILNFSTLARPLTSLTKKNAKFKWEEEEQAAYDALCQELLQAPILAYPDVRLPYHLYCDSSLYAVGGILTQCFPEGERVIQYLSHQLSATQQKWPTIEREAYAIYCITKLRPYLFGAEREAYAMYCITRLRPYLFGADFTVYTDHKPLKSLFTAQMANTKCQRWAILLDEYGCKIDYHKGSLNVRADFLSRLTARKVHQDKQDIAVINTDDQGTEDICLEMDSDENTETKGKDAIETLLSLPPKAGMVKLQKEDHQLFQIIKALEAGTAADKVANEYVLEDNLLYHIAEPVRLDPDHRLQLALPAVLLPEVLQAYHDRNGHLGIDKTYAHIRSRYFWQGMYKDVVRYCTNCITCNSKKLRKNRIELQEMPMPEAPFQIIGIDTCGPYVESFSGNKYLLTIVDWFSGYLEAFPIPDKSANSVARVLMEEFIPRHSVPSRIVSDNGTEFCCEIIDLLSAELNIHRVTTSPFHPQSNGRVEASHKTINSVIAKALEGQDHRNWDTYVPTAVLAINCSVSETTKQSPFFVVYGRDPQLPMDTLLGPKQRYMGDEYVPTMLGRMHKTFALVKENTKEARQRAMAHFNEKASKCEYQVGDPIYYLNRANQPGTSTKFNLPWQPFYRIVEQTSPVNYRIRHQPTGKTKVVHAENIRAANPQAIWDKERSKDCTKIGNKYKPKAHKLQPEEPTRVQPLRACKLIVPQSAPLEDTIKQDSQENNRPIELDRPIEPNSQENYRPGTTDPHLTPVIKLTSGPSLVTVII